MKKEEPISRKNEVVFTYCHGDRCRNFGNGGIRKWVIIGVARGSNDIINFSVQSIRKGGFILNLGLHGCDFFLRAIDLDVKLNFILKKSTIRRVDAWTPGTSICNIELLKWKTSFCEVRV